MEEKPASSYLTSATGYLSTFLPSFSSAQQSLNSVDSDPVELRIEVVDLKIEVLDKQLSEKLQSIPNTMPVKIINTITGKINELLVYINVNKIDVSHNLFANNFFSEKFSNIVDIFAKVPVNADPKVLERAKDAYNLFVECYNKSAELFSKPLADETLMQKIDQGSNRFANTTPHKPS